MTSAVLTPEGPGVDVHGRNSNPASENSDDDGWEESPATAWCGCRLEEEPLPPPCASSSWCCILLWR